MNTYGNLNYENQELQKYLWRYFSNYSKRKQATPQELKAYKALEKYKSNDPIFNIIHIYERNGIENLSIWIGG